MRLIPLIAILLALGCLLTAGGLYWQERREQAPEPPLSLEPTQFTLADLAPGQHELVIRIHNPSQRDRRIVGLLEG